MQMMCGAHEQLYVHCCILGHGKDAEKPQVVVELD